MTDNAQTDQARYREARDAFGRLDASEQAAFALEALLAASGTLVQEAGRHAAAAVRDIERAFDDAFKTKPAAEPAAAKPPASEPDVAPDTPSP